MNLCKYRNIFGKPNEGAHRHKIFGFALVDIIATLLASLLISYVSGYSYFKVLIFLLIVGQLLHYIFCVNTTFMNSVLGIFFPQ